MALYGYSFKFKFTKPGQKKKINPKELTLLNIVKKGTKHGVNKQISLGINFYVIYWWYVLSCEQHISFLDFL